MVFFREDQFIDIFESTSLLNTQLTNFIWCDPAKMRIKSAFKIFMLCIVLVFIFLFITMIIYGGEVSFVVCQLVLYCCPCSFLIFTLHITLEFPLRPIGNNSVHKFQFLNIGLNNLFALVKLFFKCKGCFWLIYICNITDIFVFTSCIKCTVNYICRLILLHGIFFKDDIDDNLEFQSHYKGKCTYLLNGNVN